MVDVTTLLLFNQMSWTRRDLLKYVFDKKSTPTSVDFMSTCEVWMVEKFPNFSVSAIRAYLTEFCQKTTTKFKTAYYKESLILGKIYLFF